MQTFNAICLLVLAQCLIVNFKPNVIFDAKVVVATEHDNSVKLISIETHLLTALKVNNHESWR